MSRKIMTLILAITFLGPGMVEAASPRDASCAADVATLASDAFAYSAQAVAWLTGCVQAEDGSWVWPETAQDARLGYDWNLTADQQVVADALAEQSARLLSALDRAPYYGDPNTSWGDYFRRLDAAHTSGYGLGVGGALALSPSVKGFALDSYRPLLMSWLQEIDALDLAYMVQWWEQGKLGSMPAEVRAVLSGQQGGNTMVMAGYADATGFWRTPWPWELAAPFMQAWFATVQLPAST